MGFTTRLDADKTRWQIAEERQHLVMLELLLQHHFASLIDPMNLKDVLRQINTIVIFVLTLPRSD